MAQIQQIVCNLNLQTASMPPVTCCVQYDTGYRVLRFNLYNGAAKYTIPDDVTATIRGTKPDGYGFTYAAGINSTRDTVFKAVTEQMSAVSGDVVCEIVLVDPDDRRIAALPFILKVIPAALNENTVISESEILYAEQVLSKLQSVAAFKSQLDANTANIATNKNNIAVNSTRIDTITRLPSGSTTGDAELMDIRVMVNGQTAPTAGDAVREQIQNRIDFENMNLFGAYDASQIYGLGDLVVRNDVALICVVSESTEGRFVASEWQAATLADLQRRMGDNFADIYSEVSDYAVGDWVMSAGRLYQCITSIDGGEAWTPSHWRQITVADSVADLKSHLNQDEANLYGSVFSVASVAPYITESGKRLKADGSAVETNADYILQRYASAQYAGQIMRIVSEYSFGFYTSGTVSTANLIGNVYGAGTYWLNVPSNASALFVSVTQNGNQSPVSLAANKLDASLEDIDSLEWFSNNLEIEGFSRTYDAIDLKSGATKTTGYYMRRDGVTSSASGWNYYKASVTPGWYVHVKSYQNQSAILYVVCASDDSILVAYPSTNQSGAVLDMIVKIPENASYILVNENPTQFTAIIERLKGVLFLDGNNKSAPIAFVKNGHNIQIRTPFEKTDKFMAINCTDNGSQNGGFNISSYILLDALPDVASDIATGTEYKGAGDDICPIHYNGSYRGANHGFSPTWQITANGHGKAEADIGSVWTDANNRQYVIYRIDNENKFSVIGNTDTSRYGVNIFTPSTSLTHVSGATHTGTVTITTASSVQMLPTFKNYSLSFTDENGKAITQDGAYFGYKHFQMDESYECLSVSDIVTTLKTNVGSNTNSSYYADTIDANLLIQNSFKVFPNGSIVVACNAVPLKTGVYIEYWGGVQSGKIGDDIYAPFTNYDSIQTQSSSSVNLTSSTWKDVDFPAYKMFQFSGNNGFAVGYCIDYGQGLPATRKDNLSGGNGAGFWYGSSHKMYPHFNDVALADAVDGQVLSFYAFRAPVLKSNSMAIVWYEIDNDVYVEVEAFAQNSGIIELPLNCSGRKISIVKKTESISIPVDVVSASGIYFAASGAGSATLKIY